MLDRRFVSENAEVVRAAVRAKGETRADVDAAIAAILEHRACKTEADDIRRRINELSRQVGAARREGRDATVLMEESRRAGDRLQALEDRMRALDARVQELLQWIPNLPAPDVPVGEGSSANRVVRQVGEPIRHSFPAKPHWEIGARLGIFDEERGARLAGSNFVLFRGAGARLVRALINFMLDVHTTRHGYVEIWPPALSRPAAMFGSGQLPKMKDDMYRLERDDLYLVPTAEVPLTNMFAGEILPAEAIPLKVTAYTPCFRREAGAYGRETRGLLRIHQFDKVELVQYVHPDRGFEALEEMVGHAEAVLQALGLTYRVVLLGTGDMSFASAKTYDIEAWAPAIGKWLEVSSVSNCTDFQARRIGVRFRDADGKLIHPHLLNGSGVALPRTIAALWETHQQPDGTVRVPEPLRPYLGGIERIAPET
jgi:seryl-tRNA synthetase